MRMIQKRALAMTDQLDAQIRAELDAAKSIVIISHIRPDGDAYGSSLALGLALRQAGKQVQVVLQDGIAEKFRFLMGADSIQDKITSPFDYLIVVDCSDFQRTGHVLDGKRLPDLVIDHHKTHGNFGRLDLVEPQVEATALILANHMPDWGLVIDKNVGEALVVGILTDTLGFRTSNVHPEALRVTANLMEKGVDLPFIYHQVLLTRTVAEVRYWGQGFTKIHFEDGLLWTELSLDDRIISGYVDNDDADMINTLSAISEAEIVILFIEQQGGGVKVSWRSVEGIDVSLIAFDFGGGGHAAAAGADISGNLQEVEARVLAETKSFLSKSTTKRI